MFYFQLEGFKSWLFWVPKSIYISLALLWSVAESDLQLGKEGGGGRFSLACPASFSSFIDFFTQNKEGDGLGRVSWWHLSQRCLLSSRDFYLQTPALLKAELWKLSIQQYSTAFPPPPPSSHPPPLPTRLMWKGVRKLNSSARDIAFLSEDLCYPGCPLAKVLVAILTNIITNNKRQKYHWIVTFYWYE